MSSGSYAHLYPEPFYFAFNPNAKFSEDSDVMEGLSSVYENTDEDGNELPIQMVTYNENYTALLNALLPYKDEMEKKDKVKSLADAMTKMLLQDDMEAFHARSYEIAKAYLTEEVEKKWKELVG